MVCVSQLATETSKSVRASNTVFGQITQPDALQKYRDGEIDTTEVAVAVAPADSTVAEYARVLRPEGEYRDIQDVIAPQSTANGEPGVQEGERFVVRRSDIPDFAPNE